MLLDLPTLVTRHGMKVSGVVHAGAHLAEEAAQYQRLFAGRPVWWIEANPDVVSKIQTALAPYPAQQLIQALLWDRDGQMLDFHVTNYDGMSSSILHFGTHPEFSPDTKFTHQIQLRSRTIDTLVDEFGISGCNFLNMDLQGVELQCLRGAERLVTEQIDYINSEVNTEDVYRGCTKLHELDAHLAERGFTRVATEIVPGQGWGDALWVRTTPREPR